MLKFIPLNAAEGAAYLQRRLAWGAISVYYDTALLNSWQRRRKAGQAELTDLTAPNLLVEVAGARVVGTVSFREANLLTNSIEIGYGVAAQFRRRGFATEGVKLALEHLATHHPKLRQVTAYVSQDNPASMRVLTNNAFEVAHLADEIGLVTYRLSLG